MSVSLSVSSMGAFRYSTDGVTFHVPTFFLIRCTDANVIEIIECSCVHLM